MGLWVVTTMIKCTKVMMIREHVSYLIQDGIDRDGDAEVGNEICKEIIKTKIIIIIIIIFQKK